MIKGNISLNQFERCFYNRNIFKNKINCAHWSLNKSCSDYCLLKKEETNIKKCSECNLREEIGGSNIGQTIQSSIQDLRKKFPQTNVFNPSVNLINQSEKNLNNQNIEDNEDNKQSFLQKAVSYGKAEGSQLFSGKVSLEVYEERKNICKECPNKTNPKPDQEELGWCTKCGCSSRNPRAALTNKLWMPSFECPIKKFGKSSGTGFNAKDALNSIKGAAEAIVNTIEEQKGIT